jgi:hypothetical protein
MLLTLTALPGSSGNTYCVNLQNRGYRLSVMLRRHWDST